MLLGTQPKLAELLVHCFRLKPRLTAEEIYLQVLKKKKVTKRAVFKELASLVNQSVLVRMKGAYAVKMTWILDILKLGEDLSAQSLNPKSLDLQIPSEGEKCTWKFRDLRRMDAFWEQMVFLLYSISKSKKMYVWCPHFWFYLFDFEKELQVMRAMHHGKNKRYYIIGGDTFIDKIPARYWNSSVYEWVHAPHGFKEDERIYYDVIDNFILSGKFSRIFVEKLDRICRKTKTMKDLETPEVRDLLNTPATVTLTLEYNVEKAAALKKSFQPYFI